MTNQDHSRVLERLAAVSAWAAIGVFGIGSLVLVGWICDIEILKSLNPNLISMKANTAVAFMLTGIALWLSQIKRIHFRPGRNVAWMCASLVAAMGLLTLMEYAFGWNLGIDQLLFREPSGAVQTIYPGRMAPNTALNFLLIGLSLILLDVRTRRGHRPAQYLIALGAIVVTVALVGYVYNASRLYTPSTNTNPMSLITALTGIIAFLGLGLTRPGPGIMTLLTGENAGSIMVRRLLLPVLLVPILVDLLFLTTQRLGIFEEHLASGINIVLVTTFILGLVWLTAVSLNRADTERHKAEAAQANLSTFPKLNPFPIAEADLAGRILFLNPAAERLFPDLREKGLQHPWFNDWRSIGGALQQEGSQTMVREVLVGEKCFQQAIYYVKETQSIRIYALDITDRKRAEEAWAKERTNLQTIFDVANVGLLLIDEDGVVQRINNTLSHWIGKDLSACPDAQPGDFIGCIHALADPAGCGHTPYCASCPIRNTFESVLHTGEPIHDVEAQAILTANGNQTPLWFEASADPLVLDGRRYVVLALNNITQRKKAEEALKKAHDELELRVRQRTEELQQTMNLVETEHQRFQEVLDQMPAYVILLSPDYHVPFANRFFEERFGKSEGRRCFEYLFNRTEPCENCETYKVLKTNAPHHWEWTGPDGRNYDIHDFPFTDADGSPLIMEVGLDITERKQAEAALRSTSLYARGLLEASLDPLATISPKGKITDVNQATELVTGVARKELIGSDFSAYFTDPQKAGKAYRQVLSQGYIKDYPLTIRHTSGRTTDVHYNATVYKNPSGEVQGVFAAARDITEHKRMDEQLHRLHEALRRRASQLQKLASELTLVEQRERRRLAQLLHDHLQQLLYAARLSLSTLRRRVQDQDLHNMIQHVDALLGQCIDESRSLTHELSPPVLYDGGLMPALEWLARQMQQNYKLTVAVDADAEAEPEAEDIKILLFHSVRELLFNVVKHAQAHSARVKMSRMPDRQICIEIIDNGIGLDLDKLHTQEENSAGFGLFSIRERLEQLGGRLEMQTAPGKGTRVSIFAPSHRPPTPVADGLSAQPSAAAISAEENASAKPIVKIRVLLADDHAIFRQGLLGVLNQEPDIEVVGEAADGEMAVELAGQLDPDVILMDVTMPNVDGIEATRRITATLQRGRIIGLSAHKEEDLAKSLYKAGAISYLSKDEPTDLLLATIRNVMSTAHAP